jgi:hypothetical protein
MRIKTWMGAVGAALLTAACAGGPREGPPPGFGDDEPGEGPRPPRAQLFISPAGQPFRAPGGQPYPVADWFAKADADRDGRLTRDEFRADADAWFTTLDANADGQISMPEVSRWEEELIPEMSRVGVGMAGADPRGRRRSGGVNTRLQGAAAYSLINEPHPIRGADSDFSFGVSRAEWRAASDRRFALLDVDADGAILAADLRPTPVQAMRAGDGEGRMERRPAIGVLKRQR